VEEQLSLLEGAKVKPDGAVNELIRSRGGAEIRETVSAARLLKRPEITADDLKRLGVLDSGLDDRVARQIEIRIKYEGYIDRQKREANQFLKMEKVAIPEGLDYDQIPGLSRELREKLKSIKPGSLGQVSRVPGVTPAALSALMVRIRK
jgi:tRNA uridine 5-carboxymethylaminomethyl modification enzyme